MAHYAQKIFELLGELGKIGLRKTCDKHCVDAHSEQIGKTLEEAVPVPVADVLFAYVGKEQLHIVFGNVVEVFLLRTGQFDVSFTETPPKCILETNYYRANNSRETIQYNETGLHI